MDDAFAEQVEAGAAVHLSLDRCDVTETIYRHQIRPVITIGAEAMDKIFANEQ